jgi:hypothetical protein
MVSFEHVDENVMRTHAALCEKYGSCLSANHRMRKYLSLDSMIASNSQHKVVIVLL